MSKAISLPELQGCFLWLHCGSLSAQLCWPLNSASVIFSWCVPRLREIVRGNLAACCCKGVRDEPGIAARLPSSKQGISPPSWIHRPFQSIMHRILLELYSSGVVIKAPQGQGFYTGYSQTHSCLNPCQEKLNNLIWNTSLGLMDLRWELAPLMTQSCKRTGIKPALFFRSSFCSFSIIRTLSDYIINQARVIIQHCHNFTNWLARWLDLSSTAAPDPIILVSWWGRCWAENEEPPKSY